MTHPTAHRVAPLDRNRIVAGAGAIGLNGALLLLLLIPITVPPMLLDRVAPKVPDVVFVDRKRPEPKVEPEVVPVQPARSTPQPKVAAPHPPQPQPPAETTSEPQPGDIVVPPSDSRVVVSQAVTGPADVAPPGPMQGAHLEYGMAPPPPYPRGALLDGLTGTVMLQVLVDVDGRPLEVTVKRSSGHRELDIAARRQVLSRWTFRPAIRDGRPVQAIGVIPVEFKLD